MKSTSLFSWIAAAVFGALPFAVLPPPAAAQSTDVDIDRALLAAPDALRDGAAVIAFDETGSIVVVREGTNGLMCWDSSDEPGAQGRFSSQCTSEMNRARVEQNHRFENADASPEEIREMFERAEADGTREVAEFGTAYYHLIGDDLETGSIHTTIAVPFATEASHGFPERPQPGGLWIMNPGNSGAHLMMPGM